MMDVLEPFTCPASALHSAPYPGLNIMCIFLCFLVCVYELMEALGSDALQFVCFLCAVAPGSVSGAVGTE